MFMNKLIKLTCGLNGVLKLKEYFFLCIKGKIQSVYENTHKLTEQHLTWRFFMTAH